MGRFVIGTTNVSMDDLGGSSGPFSEASSNSIGSYRDIIYNRPTSGWNALRGDYGRTWYRINTLNSLGGSNIQVRVTSPFTLLYASSHSLLDRVIPNTITTITFESRVAYGGSGTFFAWTVNGDPRSSSNPWTATIATEFSNLAPTTVTAEYT